MEVRVAA